MSNTNNQNSLNVLKSSYLGDKIITGNARVSDIKNQTSNNKHQIYRLIPNISKGWKNNDTFFFAYWTVKYGRKRNT